MEYHIELDRELTGLRAFKKYVMDMQGQGLSVEGAHLNVENKPMDAIIDFARQYEEEAAGAIQEPVYCFGNEIISLNLHVKGVVNQLAEEAKRQDGTYHGAIRYLGAMIEQCQTLDNENDGTGWHISAQEVRKRAIETIENEFSQEIERHKHRPISWEWSIR